MAAKNKKRLSAVDVARRVIGIEAAALEALMPRLDDNFSRAVDLILATEGRVVVSGMGKSGIICQKIASTLASTGTPSFFLHPAEGVHGDLGMVMKGDVLVAVSNSGETEEILKIVPVIKRMGLKMIAMTGGIGSTLAGLSDVHLDIGVKEEACPLGLAPTASTTACLAMGDAIAVALLEKRGFKAEDFALLHPAGRLGRRFLRVEDLMHSGKHVPRVNEDALMKDVIVEMTAKRLGITGVFRGKRLVGAISDGDLRRAVSAISNGDIMRKKALEVMTRRPKFIERGSLAEAALRKMEEHSITVLFVGNEKDGVVDGAVHMHDLLKAGVV